MKTIVLETPGQFRMTETAEPTAPQPGEALVRVKRVGICGTDLHAFRGRQPFFSYPRILGHELGVEVVALGAVQEAHTLHVGDLCTVEPYLNCGVCSACRRGKSNCCQSLKVLGVHIDGGMREYIKVPLHKLHKAQGAPVEHLAVVEMLCIGAHAVRRAQITPGENALVVGAGPIGLATMQFAKLAGAEVICLELNPNRIEFCRQHLGVQHFINATQGVEAELQRLLGGDMPTLVFDATGNAQSMMGAFNYVAHGGKLIFVGLVQGELSFNDPYFHSHELTLLATRNATSADFAYVVDCLNLGKIKLDPWFTHRASPAEFIKAFPTWLDPANGVVKAMLDFG